MRWPSSRVADNPRSLVAPHASSDPLGSPTSSTSQARATTASPPPLPTTPPTQETLGASPPTTHHARRWWAAALQNYNLPHPRLAQEIASGAGVSVPLTTKPKLRRWPTPREVVPAPLNSPVRTMIEELQNLELVRSINPATEPPGAYSRPFLRPKPDGGFRMLVDFRPLNEHLDPDAFKLKTIRELSPTLALAGSFSLSDIRHAFYRVATSPSLRVLTRMAIRSHPGSPVEAFEHIGLPMGMSSSPVTLQRTVTNVLATVRQELGDVTMSAYYDDVLLCSPLPPGPRAEAQAALLRRHLNDAGLPVHPRKCTPMARQNAVLGFDVDLDRGLIAVPERKIRTSLALVSRLLALSPSSPVGARARVRLAGLLNSLWPGLRFPRTHTTGLSAALADLLNLPSRHGPRDWPAAPAEAWGRRAPLSAPERYDLFEWQQRLTLLLTARWHPGQACALLPPTPSSASLVLASDASDSGWGAHLVLDHHSTPPPLLAAAASEWARISQRTSLASAEAAIATLSTHGVWSAAERQLHITAREMTAATRAVLHAATFFRLEHAHILVLSDSSAVVATINRGGSQRASMAAAFAPLRELQQRLGIYVTASHLPGVNNQQADALSRLHDDSDDDDRSPPSRSALATARISPDVLSSLRGNASFSCDLFASQSDHVAPRYIAWRPELLARGSLPPLAYDALTLDWTRLARGGPLYAFPPPSLLPRVVARLNVLTHLHGVLITPTTPNAHWWLPMARRGTPRTLPTDSITEPDGTALAWPASWTSWTF